MYDIDAPPSGCGVPVEVWSALPQRARRDLHEAAAATTAANEGANIQQVETDAPLTAAVDDMPSEGSTPVRAVNSIFFADFLRVPPTPDPPRDWSTMFLENQKSTFGAYQGSLLRTKASTRAEAEALVKHYKAHGEGTPILTNAVLLACLVTEKPLHPTHTDPGDVISDPECEALRQILIATHSTSVSAAAVGGTSSPLLGGPSSAPGGEGGAQQAAASAAAAAAANSQPQHSASSSAQTSAKLEDSVSGPTIPAGKSSASVVPMGGASSMLSLRPPASRAAGVVPNEREEHAPVPPRTDGKMFGVPPGFCVENYDFAMVTDNATAPYKGFKNLWGRGRYIMSTDRPRGVLLDSEGQEVDVLAGAKERKLHICGTLHGGYIRARDHVEEFQSREDMEEWKSDYLGL